LPVSITLHVGGTACVHVPWPRYAVLDSAEPRRVDFREQPFDLPLLTLK